VSGSKTARIVFTALFVVVGLPPGLCAISAVPDLMGLVRARSPEGQLFLWVIGIPTLIGFAIFFLLLWWMIKAWVSDG
jgi:hypothetical protein